MSKSHTPLKKDSTSSAPPQKELEPLSSAATAAESLKTADTGEKKLSTELKEYITHRDEEQKMKKTEALKQVGAEIKGQEDDVQEKVGPLLALSDTKIEEGLKQPVNSSFRWFAEFMRYALRQAGYN